MPDVEKLLEEGFDALSGEITGVREMVQEGLDRVTVLEEKVDGVKGDPKKPGLVAQQSQDDDLRKYGGWAWTAAKWAAIPAFAVLSAIGTAALADHASIGENRQEIRVVKTRLEHVEAIRALQEEHHQELLDAIGGED